MNQILANKPKIEFSNKNNNIKKFKIIFWIFIFISFFSIILFIFLKYNSFKKEKISKNLINNFSISTLYSSSNDYSANFANLNLSKDTNSSFVVGVIQIDKINLLYPILSTTSDELLNIAPCRFYGPLPNEIGNLCIAGHNNANDKLFGKLDLLEINDIIKIYDLNGSSINYYIYDNRKIDANDTSCMNQDTNNTREISLITCNNIKSSRLLLKAKEGSL